MNNLWVDTDLGFDDIHALLLLRCHGIQPVAHSLVFGCATLDHVINNTQGCDRAFNIGSIWHGGAATALDGQCRTAAHVLGESGIRSRGITLPEAHVSSDAFLHSDAAVPAMINWLSSSPFNPQVLALGPLTNLAQLIIEAPELAATLTQITWMGGSAGRGNQTAHAEFNAWADVAAADIVMQSGIRIHMVELEACRKLQLIPEDVNALSMLPSPTAQLLHDLLGGYLDIGLSRGRSGMAIYDPLAAATLINACETILSAMPVHITIDTSDTEQFGRTHIKALTNASDSVHTLCVVNDVDAVHGMLIDALIKTAQDTSVLP